MLIIKTYLGYLKTMEEILAHIYGLDIPLNIYSYKQRFYLYWLFAAKKFNLIELPDDLIF